MDTPLTDLERKAIAVALQQLDTIADGKAGTVVSVEVPRRPGDYFGPHDRVWLAPKLLLRYILETQEQPQ